MKRRNFLTGIISLLAAPVVLKKPAAVGKSTMDADSDYGFIVGNGYEKMFGKSTGEMARTSRDFDPPGSRFAEYAIPHNGKIVWVKSRQTGATHHRMMLEKFAANQTAAKARA